MGDGRAEKRTGDREALRDQPQQEAEGPKEVGATQRSHSRGGLRRGGWSPEQTQPGGKERREGPWLPFLLLSPLPVAEPRQRPETQPAGAEASRGGRDWNWGQKDQGSHYVCAGRCSRLFPRGTQLLLGGRQCNSLMRKQRYRGGYITCPGTHKYLVAGLGFKS